MVQREPSWLLHFTVVEHAMSLLKIVVGCPLSGENFKVIKMLAVRMFNAFGTSLKLLLSGYFQNAGMIMRDMLETLFLLDLFKTDPAAIERWRFANDRELREAFSPSAVRRALDERDGVTTRQRAELYKMFSKLAGHPNMHSQHMLRSAKDGDIYLGPFMDANSLAAGLFELGKIGIQTGDISIALLPVGDDHDSVWSSFAVFKKKWLETFRSHN